MGPLGSTRGRAQPGLLGAGQAWDPAHRAESCVLGQGSAARPVCGEKQSENHCGKG